MTTQYTPILKLALPVTGELSGTWGDVVNDNITSMVEQAVAGLATISTWTGNSHTLTTANGTTSESRCAMLVAQNGAGLTAAGEIVCPASSKLYVLKNDTSYAITLKTSAGTGVAVASGNTAFLFCDGTNVNACVTTIVDGRVTGNLTVDGNATINGNTTLGNATSDTITATARFASGLTPSADNTYDLGSSGNSWKDVYIDGTAYLALVDINGGTIDGVSIGASTAATIINVDNLRLDGNTLSSTDTNGNVVIAPNGTGDVQLDADTVRVGDSAAAVTLTSNGAGALTVTTGGAANLILSTNSGTTSGTITINNGANGNIAIVPDGTGDVQLDADTVRIGDSNTDVTLTTNGTGNLNLTTNGGTNSGTIQIAQGANGNITLTPNGTGSVSVPKLVWSNGTSGRVPYLTTGGQFTDSANMTFDGTTLTVNSLSVTSGVVFSGGTANGVVYLNGSKQATAGSALTFDGTTFATTARTSATNGAWVGSGAVVGWGAAGTFSNYIVADTASNYMLFQVASAEQMRLTSTGLGIKTSSPSAPLDVFGNVKIGSGAGSNGARLMVNNATNTATGIQLFQDSVESWIMGMPATSGALTWAASGTEYMRLTNAGLVGIGTNAPTAKLDVVSSSNGAVTEVLRLSNNGTGDGTQARVNFYAASTNYAQITGGYSGAPSLISNVASGGYQSWQINASEQMRLIANNLLLGTTTQKVTTVTGGATGLTIGGASAPTIALWDTDNAAYVGYWSQINTTMYFGNNANGSIEFGTNAATKAILTGGGNFLIGTTTDAGRLTVSGNIRSLGGNFELDTGQVTTNSSSNPLILGVNGDGKAQINSVGSFGLGVAPTSYGTNARVFQIDGGAYASEIRMTNSTTGTSGGNGGLLQMNGNDWYMWNVENSFISFGTNNIERGRIAATGNWGIGTTDTGNGRLNIVGPGTATANSLFLTNVDGTYNPYVQFQHNGINGVTLLSSSSYGSTASNLTISVASTDTAVFSPGRLTVKNGGGTSATGLDIPLTLYNNLDGGVGMNFVNGVTSNTNPLASIHALVLSSGAGTDDGILRFNTANNGSTGERMRIDYEGRVMIGTTSPSGNFTVQGSGAVSGLINTYTTASSGNRYHAVWYESGTERGSITSNGGGVVYNSTSDYRMKENVTPMSGVLAKVLRLKPCTFTWKGTGSAGEGFIAHELAEEFPLAVTGKKDAVKADGSIKPQGVDTSMVVAALVAAMQEQQVMIDQLKAEVAALKGA